MSLEDSIEILNRNISSLIVVLQQSGKTDTGTCVPEPEKKEKKARRTKAQIAADEAAATTEPTKTNIFDDAPPPPPPTGEFTIDQVRAEASAVVELDNSEEEKGLKAAEKVLSDAGYKFISEIPEDKRAEVVAEFRKVVKSWKK